MTMQSMLPPIVMTKADHDRLSGVAEAAERQAPAVAEFLAAELERAQVVRPGELPPTVVTMYSRVEFCDDQTQERRTVTLVYPGEQNIAEGKVSILTPVGTALLGLSEGQSIEWETPAGDSKSLTVLKVLFQPEASGQSKPTRA